jgi:hypothetical protein
MGDGHEIITFCVKAQGAGLKAQGKLIEIAAALRQAQDGESRFHGSLAVGTKH